MLLDRTSDLSSGVSSSAALTNEVSAAGVWSSRWNPFNRMPRIRRRIRAIGAGRWMSRRHLRLFGYVTLVLLITAAFVVVVVGFATSRPNVPGRPYVDDHLVATSSSLSPGKLVDEQQHRDDDRLLQSLRRKTENELHELQQKLRTLALNERSLNRRIDETNDQLRRSNETADELPIVGAVFTPIDRQLDVLTERELRLVADATALKAAVETKLAAAVEQYVNTAQRDLET